MPGASHPNRLPIALNCNLGLRESRSAYGVSTGAALQPGKRCQNHFAKKLPNGIPSRLLIQLPTCLQHFTQTDNEVPAQGQQVGQLFSQYRLLLLHQCVRWFQVQVIGGIRASASARNGKGAVILSSADPHKRNGALRKRSLLPSTRESAVEKTQVRLQSS